MWSPMAVPGRGGWSGGEKMPRGRFWMGKSGWVWAEATQQGRVGLWVSSVVVMGGV